MRQHLRDRALSRFPAQAALITFAHVAALLVGLVGIARSTPAAPVPRVLEQQPAKPIYHSPQTPGYTAWCTLWRTREGELRLAFQQVTGPAEDIAKRTNVTVILGSADDGATWKTIREVPARSNVPLPGNIYAAPGTSSFCGHGFAALPDGTLITGLWPSGEQTSGYLQRSSDDGLTWSPPIFVLDPAEYKTYPTQIRRLRDGRLILVAGVVKQADAKTALWLLKEVFESRDDGKTWSHLWTMPADVGLCEESDVVELDGRGDGGGDLLLSHRAEHYHGDKYINSTRLQNIFHRNGDKWEIGPVTAVPMPHSGFPELLKLRDGSVLHIATDGISHIGSDLYTWTRLDLPGSSYYPRAIQLKDGRVLVVGHMGGDDEYGKVNQTIVAQTFLLEGQSENAKAASPTLTDLWDDKAAWVKDAERIGSSFSFHYPSIVQNGDEFWGFYLSNYAQPDGKFKMPIGRARSTDGLKWSDDGMVLDVGPGRPATEKLSPSSWDDRLTSFPGVWKDGDTWYLVYEGASEDPKMSLGDIGLATSKDGKTWTKHPNNPILRHEKTGWEKANIGTPSLYKENGTWYLFYHGYDYNVCQIGVASGKSLTELIKSPANPVLPVTPDPTAWDSGTTGRRSRIVKEGDYYYFAFEGSTPGPFAQSKWSSGLARTKNLIGVWTRCPRNPLIPQTAGGMNNDGPELVQIGKTWHMYVRHAEAPHGNATDRYRLEAR
jgi:hypothetical protein